MNTTATTLSPPVLAARDIRKSYGKGTARFDALAGVSLSVYAGESIAIVGKSGSGKSTLMHLLALLDQPDDGTLMVGNTNADEFVGAAAEPVTQPGLRVRVPTVLPHPQRHRARQCGAAPEDRRCWCPGTQNPRHGSTRTTGNGRHSQKTRQSPSQADKNNESSSPAPW